MVGDTVYICFGVSCIASSNWFHLSTSIILYKVSLIKIQWLLPDKRKITLETWVFAEKHLHYASQFPADVIFVPQNAAEAKKNCQEGKDKNVSFKQVFGELCSPDNIFISGKQDLW